MQPAGQPAELQSKPTCSVIVRGYSIAAPQACHFLHNRTGAVALWESTNAALALRWCAAERELFFCGGICFFAVVFISSVDVMRNCEGSLSRDKFLF